MNRRNYSSQLFKLITEVNYWILSQRINPVIHIPNTANKRRHRINKRSLGVTIHKEIMNVYQSTQQSSESCENCKNNI